MKTKYKYHPKNKNELKKLIKKRIKKEGNECDLNDVDTSLITNMSELFQNSNFNGDISQWNTANVTNMSCMFSNSIFNQNISKWNVSNVKDMFGLFVNSSFNQDISKWDVSNVETMSYMFYNSPFNQDISKWNIKNVEIMSYMFYRLKVPLNKNNIKLIENKKIKQYIGFCSEYANKDLKNILKKKLKIKKMV